MLTFPKEIQRNGAFALAAIFIMAGCNGGIGRSITPAAPQPALSRNARPGDRISSDVSLLKQLKKQVVIGSAVDPQNEAQNPYGLTRFTSTTTTTTTTATSKSSGISRRSRAL